MKTDTPTITAADTAFVLRARLGNMRSWADFLTDNIRDRQDIGGLTLKPCARRKDARAFRPVYAVADVQAFIADVLALEPKAGPAPIKTTMLAIEDGHHWSVCKFVSDGSASKYHRIGQRNRGHRTVQ